jgi:excisionase family DNA binding protein
MTNETSSNGSAGGPPAPWGDSPFLDQLTEATLAITNEFGIGPNPNIDVFFLGFLRLTSRFGVFSFGPITIYVPTIEQVVRRTASEAGTPGALTRFSTLVREEQERLGGGPINELHALLAFMRLNEDTPGRVFGELGVRPEQVEEYARAAGAGAVEPEKLYSPEEAADYLGIHVQTVRAWIRSGRLAASRLAGQRALRIKASDLLTVLEPVDPSE